MLVKIFPSTIILSLSYAIDEIEMYFILSVSALILVEVILIIMQIRVNKRWSRVLLSIMSVLFLIPVIFCFQPQMKLYMSGTILCCASLIGIFVAMRPWRM
jgi:hypothetical protein